LTDKTVESLKVAIEEKRLEIHLDSVCTLSYQQNWAFITNLSGVIYAKIGVTT
jgi:hypothetical protein